MNRGTPLLAGLRQISSVKGILPIFNSVNLIQTVFMPFLDGPQNNQLKVLLMQTSILISKIQGGMVIIA